MVTLVETGIVKLELEASHVSVASRSLRSSDGNHRSLRTVLSKVVTNESSITRPSRHQTKRGSGLPVRHINVDYRLVLDSIYWAIQFRNDVEHETIHATSVILYLQMFRTRAKGLGQLSSALAWKMLSAGPLWPRWLAVSVALQNPKRRKHLATK